MDPPTFDVIEVAALRARRQVCQPFRFALRSLAEAGGDQSDAIVAGGGAPRSNPVLGQASSVVTRRASFSGRSKGETRTSAIVRTP